ncbi:ABC transporter permease [Candidatus Solincola sp.]|nr:ABC transporter permease [Actinomycetota bacterium]
MRSIKRGLRSFVRHPLANLVVVLLLFVCLTFSLSMLAVKMAADSQVGEVKKSVGNYAEVRVSSEYQMQAFQEQREQDPAKRQAEARKMSEEELLAERTELMVPEALVDDFSSRPEVISYDKVLETLVILPDVQSTELASMLSLRSGPYSVGASSSEGNSFFFEGNTDGASAADFLRGAKVLVDGSFYTYQDYLLANPVVLVEKTLAEENGLQVGDTITAKVTGSEGRGSEMVLTVKGIYETVEVEQEGETRDPLAFNPAGSKFYAPLSVVQALNNTPGYVELGCYYLDSADSSAAIQEAFQETVVNGTEGGDRYELATDYSDFKAISDPLHKVARTSVISLAGALAACALIIVLAMAIIVGGRTRELGVLKAIGATDRQVLLQYAAEITCICLVAVILATGASAVVSQRLGDWLLQEDAVAAEQALQPGQAQGTPAARFMARNLYKEGGRFSLLGSESAEVELEVVYRGGLLAYGILILLGISLLGMAVPVVWINRLRPARMLTME